MTLGAKILVATAILCLALWSALMALGVQPLTAVSRPDIVYGEGEDFFSDAEVFQKVRNDLFLLVHLPHARPAYSWMSVDFENTTITFTVPPRSLGSWKYRLKNDERNDIRIGAQGSEKDWYWHFTEQGAAFSGNGFSFRMRKVEK